MERDYRKENERNNEINKIYKFKLKKEIAKQFDEKLKAENRTATSIFVESVNKYLDK